MTIKGEPKSRSFTVLEINKIILAQDPTQKVADPVKGTIFIPDEPVSTFKDDASNKKVATALPIVSEAEKRIEESQRQAKKHAWPSLSHLLN